MLQKLRSALVCAGVLFSANCLAMTYDLVPNRGLAYEIELPPNESQTLANPLFWTVTATCTITTEDKSDDIFVEALNKTGKVNGEDIMQGDSRTVTVHAGDTFVISANSGAKVRLTNQGEHTVLATCSV